MEGQITQIWPNKTSTGKPYWTMQIEGQRYTVWKPELVNDLKPGDYVRYEFKANGRYRNISEMQKTRSPGTEYSQNKAPTKKPIPEKDLRIIRMSCLRSATQLLNDSDLDWEMRTQYALDVARQFEEYVIEYASGLEQSVDADQNRSVNDSTSSRQNIQNPPQNSTRRQHGGARNEKH